MRGPEPEGSGPLRTPGIILLWIAQFLSQFGDSIFQLAFIWLILDRTGSKSATGLAATISYLPALLFGIAAGLLVDRWNRRAVMIGAAGLWFWGAIFLRRDTERVELATA